MAQYIRLSPRSGQQTREVYGEDEFNRRTQLAQPRRMGTAAYAGDATDAYPMAFGQSRQSSSAALYPMRFANQSSEPIVPIHPSIDRTTAAFRNALNARKQADFAQNAAPPATASGQARRIAYVNEQRSRGGLPRLDEQPMYPGYPTQAAPQPAPQTGTAAAGPSLRDRAYTYNAVARGSSDPEYAGQISGLYPNSPATQPTTQPSAPTTQPAPMPLTGNQPSATPLYPGYPTQQQQPTELEVGAQQLAAAAQRKQNFPITVQHAKAMWDTIQKAGVGQEGYTPVPIFQRLLGEYGVSAIAAAGMADTFTRNAAMPDERYLNPSQLQEAHAAHSPYDAAQAMNPFASGNVLPGYDLAPKGGRIAGQGMANAAPTVQPSQQSAQSSASHPSDLGFAPQADGTWKSPGGRVYEMSETNGRRVLRAKQ